MKKIEKEEVLLLILHDLHVTKKKGLWQGWDSNPRHRNDWCLKPAP